MSLPNAVAATHRLFTTAPDSLSSSAARVLPRLLYRLPSGPDTQLCETAVALGRYGCGLIAANIPSNNGSRSTAGSTALGVAPIEQILAESRCVFRSFGADDFPQQLEPRTAAVEWRLIAGEAVLEDRQPLAPLAVRLPIDIDSLMRLRQRVSLCRDSLPESTMFGLAVSVDSADANADVFADLPIDFLTVISPASVLAVTHPAIAFVGRDIASTIRKYLHRFADRGDRICIICQPPLNSGYDVAYYLACGADAVIINGHPLLSSGRRPEEIGERLFDVTTAFAGAKVGLPAAAGPLEQFFAQVTDGARYFNVAL